MASIVVDVTPDDYIAIYGTDKQKRMFLKFTTNYQISDSMIVGAIDGLVREIAEPGTCSIHAGHLCIRTDPGNILYTTISSKKYIKLFGTPKQQNRFCDLVGSIEVTKFRKAQQQEADVLNEGFITRDEAAEQYGRGKVFDEFQLTAAKHEAMLTSSRKLFQAATNSAAKLTKAFASIAKAHGHNNGMIERDGPAVNYIVCNCSNEVVNLLIRVFHMDYCREYASRSFLYIHTDNNDEAPVELSPEDFLDKFGTVAQQQELVKIGRLANSNLRMIVNTDVTGQW